MERTQEELGKLLLGRRLVRIRQGEGYLEDGSLEEFTITGIKVYDHVVALLGSEREAVYIIKENLDEFLAGKELRYYCLMYCTYVKLLSAEEEEHVEPEPATPEPEPEPEPAKPALPAKWEDRWWDVYLHLYKDGIAVPYCASGADNVVAFARKYLEGE